MATYSAASSIAFRRNCKTLSSLASIYDRWEEGGKIATGHSHITILRALVNFGAITLQDGQCERLQTETLPACRMLTKSDSALP